MTSSLADVKRILELLPYRRQVATELEMSLAHGWLYGKRWRISVLGTIQIVAHIKIDTRVSNVSTARVPTQNY